MDVPNKSILPKRDLVDEIIRHQLSSTDVRQAVLDFNDREKTNSPTA